MVYQQRIWRQGTTLSARKESNLSDRLNNGEFLTSPDGQHHLVCQNDGNMMLFRSWLWVASNCVWSSGSAGKGTGPYTLIMQGDGNFVMYGRGGNAVWASGTYGRDAVRAILQNGPQLILQNGGTVWKASGIKPVPNIVGSEPFEKSVLPDFMRGVQSTLALENALLSLTDMKNVAAVLKQYVPAIALYLTNALNMNHQLLRETEARVANALITQKDLLQAEQNANNDLNAANGQVTNLEQQIATQRRNVGDAERDLKQADRDLAEAKRKYDADVAENKRLKTAALAMIWMPFVAAALGIASVVSDSGVKNAETVVRVRSNNLSSTKTRLDQLTGTLESQQEERDKASSLKNAAQARRTGLASDMEALKVERNRLADLDTSLKAKASSIGLVQGSAKVMERQSNGGLSLSPLVNTFNVMARQMVDTKMLSDTEARKLTADAKTLTDKASQINLVNVTITSDMEAFIS